MTAITVESETLQLIVQAAAEAAAREIAQELRAETVSEFGQMERRLTDKLDNYFGKVEPSKHVVQHDRIERLLNLVDRMGEGIFQSILKQLIWGLVVAGVVGWLLWHKLTGGAG
jgi:vacuolar-type H+-ATPase subunit E/Vma4